MKLLVGAFLVSSLVSPRVPAQDFSSDSDVRPRAHIVYAAETHTVAAGKPSVIELHFRVLEGYHVNSHTPTSEFQIPTSLKLDPAAGVKAGAMQYPAGTAYSFSFDPNEKLDVYSGPFTVKVPVVAAPGEHHLTGSLHYQACDHAACYPPKTLQLDVFFTAK